MNYYRKYIIPRATHFLCSLRPAMKQREKVVPLAKGRVLEIGIGTGLNLPYYAPGRVTHLWGLDPYREMWGLGEQNLQEFDFKVDFIEAPASDIPLENNCADSVVITYTLCTIADVIPSLEEIRRVLKRDGILVFCEHGTAPDKSVQRWQNWLNPAWKRLAGGCNLNRDVPALLQQGGFRIRNLETMYIPGWKPGCFNYWGTASPN
jgi:ubiquinone/menaquinone biosynthesis C-methylase UbiE